MTDVERTVATHLELIIDQYNAAAGQAKAATTALKAEVQSLQAATGQAAAGMRPLDDFLRGYSHNVEDSAASTRNWGQDLTNVGGILTRTVTPAAAAAALAIKEFQDGQNALRAGTGETGAALDSMTDSMKNIGSEVPVSLKAIGAAMAEVHDRTGQVGQGLEDLTKQLVELPRLGQNVSADQITQVFTAWTIATKDQSGALDELFRISQASGTSMATMAGDLGKLGPELKMSGLSFKDAAETAAQLAAAGLNVQQIMRGMGTALSNLAKEGKDPKVALAELIGEIHTLGNTQTTVAEAGKVFGAANGPVMVQAIMDGRFSLEALNKKLGENSDTINSATQDTLHFSDTLVIWKNDLAAALGPLGDVGMIVAALAVGVGPAALGVGTLTTRIAALDVTLAGTGAALGTVAVALLPAVVAFGVYKLAAGQAEDVSKQFTDTLNKGFDQKSVDGQREQLNGLIKTYNDLHDQMDSINRVGGDMQMLAHSFSGGHLFGGENDVPIINQKLNDLGQVISTDGDKYKVTEGAARGFTDALHAQAPAAVDAATAIDLIEKAVMGATSAQISYDKAKAAVTKAEEAVNKAQERVVDTQHAYAQATQRITDAETARLDSLHKLAEAQQTVAAAQAAYNLAVAGPSEAENVSLEEANLHVAEAIQKKADAQAALNKAEADGSGLDVANAKLALTAAQVGIDKAQSDLHHAQAAHGLDLTAKTQALQSAQDQLTAAQHSAKSAAEGVTQAHWDQQHAATAVHDAEAGVTDATNAAKDATDALGVKALELKAKVDIENQALHDNAGALDAVNRSLDSQIAKYTQLGDLKTAQSLAGIKADVNSAAAAAPHDVPPTTTPTTGFHFIDPVSFAHVALGAPFALSSSGAEKLIVSTAKAAGIDVLNGQGSSVEIAERGMWSRYEDAGGRAYGGQVTAGGLYKVNELASHGAGETFMAGSDQYLIPKMSGNVLPHPPQYVGGASSHRTTHAEFHSHFEGMPTETAMAVAEHRALWLLPSLPS